ncbi:MAG: prepilin-type N-terminal cleavage/methylation domain-containing protein, partial [Deltaproteobacteria bacterium]|nr:prepilin-type N-terminal cleavage/methylation domain-containing protein [Deltaproteobacteria bacterium]
MKLSNQGFTLIELISVSVIVSTLILFISSSLSGTLSLREIISDIQLSQAGASHAELSRLIKNFFSRGRDISLTRIGPDTALVLRADLRACNTFDPA